jgi:hypothetical protein
MSGFVEESLQEKEEQKISNQIPENNVKTCLNEYVLGTNAEKEKSSLVQLSDSINLYSDLYKEIKHDSNLENCPGKSSILP